jgi:predicted DNA-binding protein with PD1-like motif
MEDLMEYKKFGNKYVLRLEIGEEIITKLAEFSMAHEIGSSKVSGIGVLRNPVISYFILSSREYRHNKLNGYFEMTSLMGNISIMEGEPFPHMHVTLADENFNVLGGHLSVGEIGVTGEIIVEPLGKVLERKISQENGLNLLAVD